MRLVWLALVVLAFGLGTLPGPHAAQPLAATDVTSGHLGVVGPGAEVDTFAMTLIASDQAGKPLANACFHLTFVQTGPSDQQNYDLCTAASGAITVNYGTGFASITLTISQNSAPTGCSGGLTSPQTYDLTTGGDRQIGVQFTCGPPPPVVGKAVDVKTVSGAVTVRVRGTTTFVPLEQLRQVPVGSEIDATKGILLLESATGVGKKTQSLTAYAGRFVVTQARKKRAVTELKLSGALNSCKARSLQGSKPKPARRLWGKGKGNFRTRGRYAAGVVRGTWWLTADFCDGTVVSVKKGVVTVTDLVKKKTVLVRAGQRYTALAPKKKTR